LIQRLGIGLVAGKRGRQLTGGIGRGSGRVYFR
jgi:hypothetical protein